MVYVANSSGQVFRSPGVIRMPREGDTGSTAPQVKPEYPDCPLNQLGGNPTHIGAAMTSGQSVQQDSHIAAMLPLGGTVIVKN